MNCRQARRLIHELLDGSEEHRALLDRHLAQCADCRSELNSLQQVQAAVCEFARCEVPAQALERTTAEILAAIEVQEHPSRSVLRLVRGAALAAVLFAVFGLGLTAGRWAWPREVPVTKVVKVPQVHEKRVKVDVPVVQERVVVKRVPVYRTRIVYRECQAPQVEAHPVAASEPVLVTRTEVALYQESSLTAPVVTVVEERRPARLVEEQPEERPSTESGEQSADEGLAETVLAELAESETSPSS